MSTVVIGIRPCGFHPGRTLSLSNLKLRAHSAHSAHTQSPPLCTNNPHTYLCMSAFIQMTTHHGDGHTMIGLCTPTRVFTQYTPVTSSTLIYSTHLKLPSHTRARTHTHTHTPSGGQACPHTRQVTEHRSHTLDLICTGFSNSAF
jgi:hypothetical protein